MISAWLILKNELFESESSQLLILKLTANNFADQNFNYNFAPVLKHDALIKKGGGTGPMKPWQPTSQCD